MAILQTGYHNNLPSVEAYLRTAAMSRAWHTAPGVSPWSYIIYAYTEAGEPDLAFDTTFCDIALSK